MRPLIALIGQLFFPGSVGEVKIGSEVDHSESIVVVLVQLVTALFALALFNFLLFRFFVTPSRNAILLAVAMHIVYVLVAFVIHPVPDESDLGWEGTIVDDPLSISDDINRGLLFWQFVLLPGRFIADAIAIFLRFAARRFARKRTNLD